MLRRYFYEVLHPEIYHGYGKKPPFFEGWYFKLVSADEQSRYAIIPGIFLTGGKADIGTTSGDHAFIQVLDGMTGQATYHQFPLETFWAHEENFEVRIGDNHFSAQAVSLNIQDEQRTISGSLKFEGGTGWPVSLIFPGLMGWYAWLPFMECYHGIVSFDHRLSGSLEIGGQPVIFDNGRGYIEKDWGKSFPSAYIWQQTNHFEVSGTCLSASVAMVPSVGRTFRGFVVGLYHHRILYPFVTYKGAVIEHLEVTDERIFWTMRSRTHRLEMISERATGGVLLAPIRTEMHKRVNETLQASVWIRLSKLDRRVIFEGNGRNAGLEVYGDMDVLLSAK